MLLQVSISNKTVIRRIRDTIVRGGVEKQNEDRATTLGDAYIYRYKLLSDASFVGFSSTNLTLQNLSENVLF